MELDRIRGRDKKAGTRSVKRYRACEREDLVLAAHRTENDTLSVRLFENCISVEGSGKRTFQ